MKLIGLTGVAGSGKTTVMSYLVERHGFTRLSFAAPLKKMLRTLDPYITEEFRLSEAISLLPVDTENALKQNFPEYRRLLQVLGTDCVRAVDEDFWVHAAENMLVDPEGKYVSDDVRFPNEAKMIADYTPWGLWNIQRPGFDPINGHVSEQHAGKMGERIWLWNGGDEEGLYQQVEDALTLMSIEEVAA